MKKLYLVVDMYGCPNRCKHCWLGHMINTNMDEDVDQMLIDYFKPYFESISYYSWVREPDYCDHYKNRWEKDCQISLNSKPMRFELASFYRLVRDDNYVHFLKEIGVKKVQLTFFGLEAMTDKYVGRKGAYQELLKATEILIANDITPRWQAFINEENKEDVVRLLDVIAEMKLYERCSDFEFFVHEGSCDGENMKLYPIRIQKENIPKQLLSYYLGYDELLEEKECIGILLNDHEPITFTIPNEIVLNVSNTLDVYYNFTNMSNEWIIGNVTKDEASELVRKITTGDTYALTMCKKVNYAQLASMYGDIQSTKVFGLDDYKMYLVNCYLENLEN